ncbi:MAG: hypothetical protein H0V16_11645 [Burkholderiaceae bacterium]|nr:hypothetical protein [Burkholderiaceae bacterium]
MPNSDDLPERWEGMHLLPERWREFLHHANETGMGYQTGNITLNDGTVSRDAVFMNPYMGKIRGRACGDIDWLTLGTYS